MSSMFSRPDLLSAAIGLAAGAGLATLKYAFAQRARLHEDLWSRRLGPYQEIWALTSQFSRWPRQRPTVAEVQGLHAQLRRWYYGVGGILMSTRSRKRYEFVQVGLAALCKDRRDTYVETTDYDDMMEIMSGLRSGLTGDLESRRKRSIVWSAIDFRDDRRTRRELRARLHRLAQKRESTDCVANGAS